MMLGEYLSVSGEVSVSLCLDVRWCQCSPTLHFPRLFELPLQLL
jgi:hypothetical protein